MKALITLILASFLLTVSYAQQLDINTKSVAINDMINFVAETYEYQSEEENDSNNITFVLQVAGADISVENLVILKQAFKLLSERLNAENTISIITYYGFSGIALEQVSPKEIKTINSTLSNLKSNIEEFKSDGIELAYEYAEERFDDASKNTIVIIRNSNASKPDKSKLSKKEIKKLKRKKRNKAIVNTAIGLLPELLLLLNK
ncbi:hypothetical protein A9Q87_12435 [Flavobacteriales bacterium 34_180_T64]|nr:hypothetical protein A9Q87_12435 [Flavobacteriales bacterium 34_180_T64]